MSALGAIPKKNSSKIRLNHDCSRPSGYALNDFTTTNKFKYQTIQDAVDLVTPNCYFAKVDLFNAFLSVKIHPSNYKATRIKWRFKGDSHDTYMVDQRLPFGASRSPEIFNRIMQSVRAIMASLGYKTVIVYLDDFLIIAENYAECQLALNKLVSLLRELGFQISYPKLEGPSQIIVFFALTLNSVNLTISIPEEKLAETRNLLSYFLYAKKVTKRQIQSLAGKLNWITQCVCIWWTTKTD